MYLKVIWSINSAVTSSMGVARSGLFASDIVFFLIQLIFELLDELFFSRKIVFF